MLEIKIGKHTFSKDEAYGISYIHFLNGIGKSGIWQSPIGNNPNIDALTREEAKFISTEILKTLNKCLTKLGKEFR